MLANSAKSKEGIFFFNIFSPYIIVSGPVIAFQVSHEMMQIKWWKIATNLKIYILINE